MFTEALGADSKTNVGTRPCKIHFLPLKGRTPTAHTSARHNFAAEDLAWQPAPSARLTLTELR